MKPFIVNRYDRIVFPFNFFPELDFSVFETLDQFAAVKRYISQMIDELSAMPNPSGEGSMLDAVELIVPHQANQTMVVNLAKAAGVAPERLYFNIGKVGNTSSASIPIAIHDAVREGVIIRPMRVFAPGFGAGAVGGYLIMRVDPAVMA